MAERDKKFEKLKFLIIDDVTAYRNLLKSTVLRSAGAVHIDDAIDGPSALKKLSRNHYDVVLCDFNLGEGKNGQQVLEEAKHRHILKEQTIFIMVTAENAHDMVMSAVEYKPDSYLTKPFNAAVLDRRIDHVLAIKEILRPIYALADRGNYAAAITICDTTIKDHPKSAMDIVKLKADYCLLSGNHELAEKLYKKALGIRDFPWAQVGLAKIRIADEEYEAASDILQDVVYKTSSNMEAYDLLAEVYIKLEEHGLAQQTLMRAVEISPLTITRQRSLGKVALTNHDFDTAENSYKSAVELGKNSYLKSSSDRLGLAKVSMGKEELEEALTHVHAAQKEFRLSSDDQLHAQIVEGMIYKTGGYDDEAQEIFDTVMNKVIHSLDTLPGDVSREMAQACFMFGEDDIGVALLDDSEHPENQGRARDRSKKYEYLQLNRKGMQLYQENRLEECVAVFEEAAQGLPDNISVNMNTAQVLIMYVDGIGGDDDVMVRVRKYLDQAKRIDSNNEKYIKLEEMYNQLNG